MEKADILLIQPPIQDFYLTRKRTVPYGLISIAAVLRNAGFKVTLFDALATSKNRPIRLPLDMTYLSAFYPQPDLSPFGLFHSYRHFGYSYEHIGKITRKTTPFLVGISSLFTPYAEQALSTAAVVKKNYPHSRIVLGGHHPTAMPEKVMSYQCVDFVIRGEGETAFLQLAKALVNAEAVTNIPGIVFRKVNGNLHVSDPVKNQDLDRLPVPAHDLIKASYYRRSKHAALTLTASRGCPMNCSYCSVGSGSYLIYRRRRVGHVFREIDHALTLGPVEFIDFEDENLAMDNDWFLSLLEGIRQRWKGQSVELRAMNGLFPPSLNKKVITAMQSSGFKILNLSLGSTHVNQLKRFKRADVLLAFDRVLNLAKTQGLCSVGYIIVAAPYQNPFESVNDLLFLAKRPVLAGVSVFYPAPGSRDYEVCRNLGILPKKFDQMRSTAMPISHTTSRTETVTLLRLGRILNFIKLLLDRRIQLPRPAHPLKHLDPNQDRLELGLHLLSWFLKDGHIRGITPEGQIYNHRIAIRLAETFNLGLKGLKLKGTK